MRFLIIRKADPDTEAGVLPDTALLGAMGAYMEEMGAAGILRGGEGVHPSKRGARVKFRAGNPTVQEGPFAPTSELLAGFVLIDVKSRDEAITWMKRWPALDGRGEVELELRQVFENEEFGDELTPEMREREDRLRAAVEGKGRS